MPNNRPKKTGFTEALTQDVVLSNEEILRLDKVTAARSQALHARGFRQQFMPLIAALVIYWVAVTALVWQ